MMTKMPRARGFDVSIKHIRAANSVALYGSFTAAAADLGMTQSAVSRLVLQLEKQLGVSLFLRSTRNVVLTAPGREFTVSARRLIEDLNIQVENARALGGQVRGRLIISCLLSLTHQVVPHAVLKYRKAHPGVEVHLSEGLGSDVHEDVRSGFADFGIGNAVAFSQEIVTEEIVQESCFAVLPSTHRLRSKPSLALRDLENEEFVSLPTSSGLRRQIDAIAGANGLGLKHTTVVEQFGTLFDFVAAAVGVAIVPASALPKKRQYKVVIQANFVASICSADRYIEAPEPAPYTGCDRLPGYLPTAFSKCISSIGVLRYQSRAKMRAQTVLAVAGIVISKAGRPVSARTAIFLLCLIYAAVL